LNLGDFQTVRVSHIIEINPRVRRFFLEYDEPIVFQSGQFIIIDFKDINHRYTTRSYSIADFTSGNTIELCVVLKEDGAATPKLFDHQVGDILVASLPKGRFVLPNETIEHDLFLICTGTGVAPFRTMIKDLLFHRYHQANIHLFFGGRYPEDLLYQEDFEKWMSEFPQFKYYPVLSRTEWCGLKGYVHEHYLKLLTTQPKAHFYICGWSEMVKETRDNLKELGYTRQDIKIELYDS
jgi:NAD(P)H-flavin reductase